MASISTTLTSPLGSRVSRPTLGNNPLRSILRRSNSTNSIVVPSSKDDKDVLVGSGNKEMASITPSRSSSIMVPECWGIVVGKEDGEEFVRLPLFRKTCSIGRDINNDIIIPSRIFSGIHCTIERADNGQITVRDSSRNGLDLNGRHIAKTQQILKHGDTLALKEFTFRLAAPMVTKLTSHAVDGTPPEGEESTLPMEQPTNLEDKHVPSSPGARLSQSLLAPQSALLLSRLVASPKRVPTPAFLKSPRLLRTPEVTHRRFIVEEEIDVDEDNDDDDHETPALSSPTAGRSTSRLLPSQTSTPKRKLLDEFDAVGSPSSKKVWFGPRLSPEVFSKNEPPATPVKRGEPVHPDTPRRATTTTATLLDRLKTASPAKPSITTPRSAQRTLHFSETLQKPQPLKLVESAEALTGPSTTSSAQTNGMINRTSMDNPFAPSSPALNPPTEGA